MIKGGVMLKHCKYHVCAVCRYSYLFPCRQLRAYSGSRNASWGGAAPSPAPASRAQVAPGVSSGQVGGDMLLPHERAARDRAISAAKAQAQAPSPSLSTVQDAGPRPHAQGICEPLIQVQRSASAVRPGSDETREQSRTATTSSSPLDGLLSHERAARERLMRLQRDPTQFMQNARVSDGRLPQERAVEERPIRDQRQTAQASYSPRLFNQMERAPIIPNPNLSRRPTHSMDGLLPHERASRERLMRNHGPSSQAANPPQAYPQAFAIEPERMASRLNTPGQIPYSANDLLPHGRAMRDRLVKSQSHSSQTSTNPGSMNQAERGRVASRPSMPEHTPYSTTSPVPTAGEPPAKPAHDRFDGLLPHERAARERLLRRPNPGSAGGLGTQPTSPNSREAVPGTFAANMLGTRSAQSGLDRNPFRRDPPDPTNSPNLRGRTDSRFGRSYGPSTTGYGSSPGMSARSTPLSADRPDSIPNKLKVLDSRSSSEDGGWSGLVRRQESQRPPGRSPAVSAWVRSFPSRTDHGVSGKDRRSTGEKGGPGFWEQAQQLYPPHQPQAQSRYGSSNSWENFERSVVGTHARGIGHSRKETEARGGRANESPSSRPQARGANGSSSSWDDFERSVNARDTKTGQAKKQDDTWGWADEKLTDGKSRQAVEHDPRPEPPQDPRQAAVEEIPYATYNDYDQNQEAARGRRNDRDRDRLEKTKKPKARRRDTDAEQEEDGWEDDERREQRRQRKAARKLEKEREKQAAWEQEQAASLAILLPELINVRNLATALGVKPNVFLENLTELGFEDINHDSIMTGETAALVAQEYGFEPTVDSGGQVDLKPRPPPEDPSSLPHRPPVVTIMGHVDHGKTTLLDWLRKSSVAAQEAGGITQHIGAFAVKLSSGKQITFLDTPGHAAFLSMRQRGANVTDIVILVVAADDSVKPQTLEALRHARAAKVPIIVAITKIDKDESRIDNVKADLAQNGVEIEEFGGDVQVVCVSGKTGQGMQDLEENILLLSEILDIRAEVDGMAEGWVLESSIKPIGRVATVLVKRGTLRRGDFIVAGKVWTKVRTMRNEAGVELVEAPPGTPVEVLGWKDPPDAGDQLLQAPDEAKAKAAVHYRLDSKEREDALAQMAQQEEERREREKAKLEAEEAESGSDKHKEPEPPGTKMINFTVKGDVHGSVEAVCAAIMEIGNNEVRPRVLRSGTGQITEFDVEHSGTAGALIINFNNSIPGHVRRQAEDAGVKILDHNIIYHLTNEIRDILSEYLAPAVTWKVLGEAEVLQIFRYNIKGRQYKNVAGCRVRNGVLAKNTTYRVIRGGQTVFQGALESLKHSKSDVSEAKKGTECGLSFVEWDEFREGDQIQAVEEIREKRRL